MGINKRLLVPQDSGIVNTENFDIVTYTGTGGTYPIGDGIDASVTINSGSANYALGSTSYGNNSGKRYFEVEYVTAGSSGTPTLMVGIINSAYQESWTNAQTKMYYANNGQKYTGGSGASYGASFDEGDVIGVAYDGTARTVTFYKNNVSQGTAFTGLVTGFPNYKPAIGTGLNSETAQFRFTTANFTYTPPTGYSEWGTSTVSAHSGTVQSSSPAHPINFQPDLVWIKSRSAAYSNRLFDSVRGATKRIISNSTDAEATSLDELTAFGSNGFTLSNGAGVNQSSATYVAWCFNAGGGSNTYNINGTGYSTRSAAGLTSGTIADAKFLGCSTNTEAGFSIIKYNGSGGSGGQTIDTGLTSDIELMIVKRTDSTGGWVVVDSVSNKYHFLNTTAAGVSINFTDYVDGTKSKLYDFATYVHYCFHSVDGYQKIGSYTGTGSSGNAITGVGFEPRFLMIKNSTAAYEWVIVDSVRGGSNELNPNSSAVENGTGDPANITVNSDGFTINNPEGATNQNNATIIYLAIA